MHVFVFDKVFLLLTWCYFLGGHLKKKRELLSLGHPRWVTAETTVTACGHSVLITHVTWTRKRTWRISVSSRRKGYHWGTDRRLCFLDLRWFVTSKDNLKSHSRFTPFWPTERAQIRESTVTRHVRDHTRQNCFHSTNTVNCRSWFIHCCFPGRWFDFTTRHVCACFFRKRDSRHTTRNTVRNMTQRLCCIYSWYLCR